jgi:hypothetical protein
MTKDKALQKVRDAKQAYADYNLFVQAAKRELERQEKCTQ